MIPKSLSQVSQVSLLASGLLGLACLVPASSLAATLVSTELVLSVDASGSVDSTEFNLQKQGYADAFRNATLIDNISTLKGGIAVTLSYWSTQAVQATGWFHITDATSALAFADAIEATTQPDVLEVGFSTNIAGGIDFAKTLLETNDFDGTRLVIDVSGDGEQNTNRSDSGNCGLTCTAIVQAARDEAVAAGIVINGLPILTDFADLDTYYTDYVIGGTGSFLVTAEDFASFETAVVQKIGREVDETPVPEPGTTAALLVGVLGASFMLQRQAGLEG